MKKVLAILVIAALMVVSLGKGGFASMAKYYEEVEEAIPAQPVE